MTKQFILILFWTKELPNTLNQEVSRSTTAFTTDTCIGGEFKANWSNRKKSESKYVTEHLGPVHTTPETFKNKALFLHHKNGTFQKRYSNQKYLKTPAWRSADKTWLVPATGQPCKKSQGQILSCELAIFDTKSSCRDQSLVPVTSPSNWDWFEFLWQVPATCCSRCLVWTIHGTSPCNQSLRVILQCTSYRDKSWGLVPSRMLTITY